jgi:DMSO/TMAO reductase YedYZ heme-binding membrane subunit
MNTRPLRYLGYVIYLKLLILPGWIFFANRGGFSTKLLGPDILFPLFGLYAFTFVAMQMIIGSNMRRLRPIFPKLLQFHRWQGLFAFTFACLHPLLITLAFGLYDTYVTHNITAPALRGYVWYGIIALSLMFVTVATAVAAWKFQKFAKTWRTIHLLNYVVFVSAWIHSWFIGSDVQTTALKYVWLFYLVAWVVSLGLRVKRELDTRAAQTTN